MLVATLSRVSGSTHQQIAYEDGRFTLAGHGEVSAQDIVDLETRGKLEWAYSGLREWVHYFATPGHGSPQGHDGANEDHDTEGTKQILLGDGQIALVDAADYARLGRWKWGLQKYQVKNRDGETITKYYANRTDPATKNLVGMHRQIMDLPPTPLEVHHLNGNGLDNRRSNLRVVTREMHQRDHTGSGGHGASRFRGVTWDEQRGLWKAHTRIRKVHYNLGYHPTEEAAARAVERKFQQMFGDLVQAVVEEDSESDPTTLF